MPAIQKGSAGSLNPPYCPAIEVSRDPYFEDGRIADGCTQLCDAIDVLALVNILQHYYPHIIEVQRFGELLGNPVGIPPATSGIDKNHELLPRRIGRAAWASR